MSFDLNAAKRWDENVRPKQNDALKRRTSEYLHTNDSSSSVLIDLSAADLHTLNEWIKWLHCNCYPIPFHRFLYVTEEKSDLKKRSVREKKTSKKYFTCDYWCKNHAYSIGFVADKCAYRTYRVNKPKSRNLFFVAHRKTKIEYENLIFIHVCIRTQTTKMPHSHVLLCAGRRSKTHL